MDLISVIVPVYNVEAYLDKCISSIVNQTYRNLEIILVDDGSPDNCPAMCDAWKEKDSRIVVLHKENGGLSDARNAGMGAAHGEFISFIDGDDWIEPRFFEILQHELEAQNADVAAVRYRLCWEGDACERQSAYEHVTVYDRQTAMRMLIQNQIKQVVWNKLYRSAQIRDIPFEKGKVHEDEFWTYQVIGRIGRFAAIDYIGYDYFQRAGSIMGAGYSPKRLDAVEAKTRRQAYLTEHMPELAPEGARDLLFTCLYHGQQVCKTLRGAEKKQAMQVLKTTSKGCTLLNRTVKTESKSHKLWFFGARHCFAMTCRIRNAFGVGV
ncbi:MAG: glycosyltransferase [Candidatus Faecousia sp.]|uniref:glycosyltransferase family 2 protein n=1 Tax=Faecousia sp. TaxID=2952921 RepID=UPI002A8B1A5A|nr:glycosyltransferase [Candidatus Faecousia sp.]